MASLPEEMARMYMNQYTHQGSPWEEGGAAGGGLIGSLIGRIWGPIGQIAGEGGGSHLGGNIGRLINNEDFWSTMMDQFVTGPIIGRASPIRFLTKQLGI
jgi:hypothetical protein